MLNMSLVDLFFEVFNFETFYTNFRENISFWSIVFRKSRKLSTERNMYSMFVFCHFVWILYVDQTWPNFNQNTCFQCRLFYIIFMHRDNDNSKHLISTKNICVFQIWLQYFFSAHWNQINDRMCVASYPKKTLPQIVVPFIKKRVRVLCIRFFLVKFRFLIV